MIRIKEIEHEHEALIEIAKNYMKTIQDRCHSIDHMNDVVAYTKELLNDLEVKVNPEVCIIGAYWHDVGRTKLDVGHEELSAKMLRRYMIEMNYDDKFIEDCCEAIQYHKWNMTPTTVEGLIIKDADKLAYLGSGRWNACLEQKQRLDDIIGLLPKLRNEILYFDSSRKIYDREIVCIMRLLYDRYYEENGKK